MRNTCKKIMSALCIGALTVGMLTGCSSSKSGSASGGKVLIAYTDTEDTFRAALADALTSQAKEMGVEVDLQNTGDSIEEQIKNIQKASEEGYSGVICRAADAATAHQIELAAGKMPVVFVNAQPEDDQLKRDKYIYVGSPEEDAGKYEGEYVYNKLGKPSEINLIIMKGEKGHSATIARSSSAKNYLKDQGCKVNITFSDYANWDPKEAYRLMDMAKKVGAKYDAVICNNDSMALGVIDWMKDNGVDPNQIPVCGVDATADGCRSIADGQMQFTCQQDAVGQAKAALETVKILSSGKSVSSVSGATEDGKYVWVPFKKVDTSNVKDFM